MTVREIPLTIEAAPQAPASRGVELIRRVGDVVVASIGLLVLSPLLVVLVALILKADDGPVIFRQERVGRNRRSFTMLKFRTMTVDADVSVHQKEVQRQLTQRGAEQLTGGVAFKSRNDPRITKIGAFLRRYSLDEVPQLLNVLRGEMSVVGPRPSLPYATEDFPSWAEPRFAVKPGLTGLWQVGGRNELSMLQMLELDVQYVRVRSLWKDVCILAKTVPTVMTGRGAA